LAKVKLNGKYGFISRGGNEIIPVKYDYIENFSEEAAGLAKAELNGNIVYIDKITGKEVTDVAYEDTKTRRHEDTTKIIMNHSLRF